MLDTRIYLFIYADIYTNIKYAVKFLQVVVYLFSLYVIFEVIIFKDNQSICIITVT